MLKQVVIYPLLFIIYLILNPLVNNLRQIDPSQVLRSFLFLIFVASLAILVIYLVSKDWHYAGYLTFIALVFFFVFGHLSRVIQDWLPGKTNQAVQFLLLAIWLVVLALLALPRVWIRYAGGKQMTSFLNLVFSIAVIGQGVIGFRELDHITHPLFAGKDDLILPPIGVSANLNCQSRPDIYYLVLDGYGNSNVLEMFYGLDNQSFLENLKGKGFFVADQSYTNYTQSIYSIPSALNFSYIEPEPGGVSGVRHFRRLIADNQVLELLKQCGYQSIAFESGFYYTNQLPVDFYFSPGFKLNEFENLLLSRTPLDMLAIGLDKIISDQSYHAHRNRVHFTFEKLVDVPRMAGPKFVFAHIISPHPPFVFDADGDSTTPEWNYSIWDGDEYPGSRESYRNGYASQIQFINRRLERTIDVILAQSSELPIIIIQGDHGPGSHLDWSSPDETCLIERTSILNAYYLPIGDKSLLYSSISPVNSFRVIFNAYFETNLEMLPDKTYFTSHRIPRQVIDITEERNSIENCN